MSAPFEVVVESPPAPTGPWIEAGATWCLTGFGPQPARSEVEAAIDWGRPRPLPRHRRAGSRQPLRSYGSSRRRGDGGPATPRRPRRASVPPAAAAVVPGAGHRLQQARVPAGTRRAPRGSPPGDLPQPGGVPARHAVTLAAGTREPAPAGTLDDQSRRHALVGRPSSRPVPPAARRHARAGRSPPGPRRSGPSAPPAAGRSARARCRWPRRCRWRPRSSAPGASRTRAACSRARSRGSPGTAVGGGGQPLAVVVDVGLPARAVAAVAVEHQALAGRAHLLAGQLRGSGSQRAPPAAGR